MLSINPLTPSTTTSTSIIPDITEKTQLGNIASTYYFPPPDKNIQPSELDTIDICPELSNKSQLSVEINTDSPIKTTEIDALLIENPETTIHPIPKKDSTTTSPIDPITGNSTKSETTNNIKNDSGTLTAEAKHGTVADITNSVITPAETKPNSSATETKTATVSEDSTNTKNLNEAKTDSPPVETKNATVSEITDSNSTTADTTPEKCKCTETVETKNTTVSEIPTSTTKPVEVKADSPTTETKNPTVSEIPTSTTKPVEVKADSPATDTKNQTVSEIPNSATKPAETKPDSSATDTQNPTKPVEVKADSPATDTKNPTVSEIPTSTTKPVEVKADSSATDTKNSTKPVEVKADSPATDTKNTTVSEIPNSATKPAETKPDSSATDTKNATVATSATNPVEVKPDSPATETKNSTVATNPIDKKPDSPATETKNPTVATKPVETKPDSPATETKNPTVSHNPVSENTQSAVTVINSIDEITGEKTEITAIPSASTETEAAELPGIPAAATDILTGEIENISLTFPNTSVNADTIETTSKADESFPPISDDEISTLFETLNRLLPAVESTENSPPSESEYTISHLETDSENPTNIPEIATTQNYQPTDSANIITNTDNQPETTIDEYANPDLYTDSEKITVIPEIASSANNQPENPPNIIAPSQSDSETKINEYPVADTITKLETTPNSPQPLIGIIDTGFAADNPKIDYSKIILGKDLIDKDNNPLLQPNEGNQHGSTILEIIAGDKNKNNRETPIWLGRATGSGNWHESLIEFVDAAKASKQPNAVVNLSFDLTQINPDGTQTTRHKLTETETAALKYAGNLISALGQASTEFNNIITVGAAENNYRAGYSSYGEGLDILAPDDIPQTAETPTTETKQGTSIAAAKVTNTISQMWAANPSLNYQQIKNILLNTAKDIDVPDWDERTGYGIINAELAIKTAAETIPAIPVLAAAKLLIKPLIGASANIGNSPNFTAAKPSERATATTTTAPGTPKVTSTSTGDYNVGTNSYISDLAPYKTTYTSSSNGTNNTNSRTLSSLANTQSNWDKSNTKTNYKGESFDESTSDSTTNVATYTSKNFSQNSTENKNQWQENRSRIKYEGTRSDSSESAQKSRSSYNYTTPTYTRNDASESYRNSKSKSNSQYGTNLSISNGDRQDDWGSKSTNNTRNTSTNSVSTSNSSSQTAGKAKWTNSSNNNDSNNTHSGEETTVNKSDSTSSTNSGPSKSSSRGDNYDVTKSTWDNTTTNGKTIGSNTRDVYSENSNNNQSSYNDGKYNNTSNRDTYNVNQSQETNSSNGSSYWQNNRGNNYSVSQGNDTQSYKSGPEANSSQTDNYSVTKSDSSSSNSNGKTTSKNNSETYSENTVQRKNEYKIDAYTTTGSSDEQTITASRSNSSNNGTNSNWFSGSDTSRTSNSQTVTTYKDGRKDENSNSSYEKWSSERTDDSKGLVSAVDKYSRWSTSYSKSSFKGGYTWTETISGYDSESGTKGKISSSSSSSWTWTRSGTVWDDGRNNWSESWSKSSWKDGKYLPSESDSKNGSFDPKKTGQINDLPKLGDAPRLNKAPKRVVPENLKKVPPPSQEFTEINLPKPPQVPGNLFAGSGAPVNRPPTFKEQIQKLLNTGAIANYNTIVALIIDPKYQGELRLVVGDLDMRTMIVQKFSQKPEMATAIMAALLKGSQWWTNPPSNDFSKYFNEPKNVLPLPYNATMNCWEMIWYAAFLCNQMTADRIRSAMQKVGYTTKPAFSAMIDIMGYQDGLFFYPNRGVPNQTTRLPKPGELVFFKNPTSDGKFPKGNADRSANADHVAIALTPTKLVSLWNQPNNNNTIQIIDVSQLKGYVQVGYSLDFFKDILW
ncbi:MAG: hypothetical protein EAZ69_12825 [Oscillatoriales cyanobacterium]|nr:MAG: hypothetical protein EAZ69_12825 [Oscillatoriales cyanobacterium]